MLFFAIRVETKILLNFKILLNNNKIKNLIRLKITIEIT